MTSINRIVTVAYAGDNQVFLKSRNWKPRVDKVSRKQKLEYITDAKRRLAGIDQEALYRDMLANKDTNTDWTLRKE